MIVRWNYYKATQHKTVGFGQIQAGHNTPVLSTPELFRLKNAKLTDDWQVTAKLADPWRVTAILTDPDA